MRLINGLILGAALAAFSLPADAAAQGRNKDRNPDRSDCVTIAGRVICDDRADRNDRNGDRRDRADRADRDRRDRADRDRRDRDARRAQEWKGRKKDRGPKFCQNGQGHPVHGREWCRQKGFGLGSARWEKAGGWGDIIFGRPRSTDRRLDNRSLADVLGGVIFGRLDSTRRGYGLDAPLTGYWTVTDGARILMVESGGFPLAQFQDRNRDGRVDAILLNRLQ